MTSRLSDIDDKYLLVMSEGCDQTGEPTTAEQTFPESQRSQNPKVLLHWDGLLSARDIRRSRFEKVELALARSY